MTWLIVVNFSGVNMKTEKIYSETITKFHTFMPHICGFFGMYWINPTTDLVPIICSLMLIY